VPEVVHPFHLALPVHSIEKAQAFYSGILNLPEVSNK
jgi:extradiol dioxygenase family protein